MLDCSRKDSEIMHTMALFGKEDIREHELAMPGVGHDGMIVRMLACGICGSDLRQYFSGPSKRYSLPIVLGHEVCAEIVALGDSVQGYDLGDRVTLAPIIPCMRCSACSRGMDNLCENGGVLGTTIPGGFAEKIFIPSQYIRTGGIVKVPTGVSTQAAALNELVSCCLHGLQQMRSELGDRVIVIGDGPIGLTFLQLVKKMGTSFVATSGRRSFRQKIAKSLGADEAFNTNQIDLRAEYIRYFDRVIVATSNIEAAYEAIDLVRPGGDILLFSGYTSGMQLDLDINTLHYQELHIHGGIDATIVDFRKASALLPELDLDEIITHRFHLRDIEKAFKTAREDDEAVKVMIVGDGEDSS
jgi:L-iditol 2-dehydrogenase